MSVSMRQGTLPVRKMRSLIAGLRRFLSGCGSAVVSCMSCVSIFLFFLWLTVPVAAQVDSQHVAVQSDSQKVAAQADSQPVAATVDSQQVTTAVDSLVNKNSSEKEGLVNIIPGNKKIRAFGWGEYRVKGRCLCCDNTNDGDCIVVHNIERTERERISQILDGKIEGDTSDEATYFGNVRQREMPDPATFLMVDISLGKMYEIRKVIVYTMMNREKRTNFLPNCELGYYDQFGRLQWMGRVECKKFDEPIVFEMDKPLFTKDMMLRVKGGKSRITEVAIFCRNQTNEKP
ncbi:MAG: hypothetical protein JXB42_00050 [Deltaproteobacteria bacterium]|nr:hypothetical protein [Deltaproteobacteria bacterium]